MEEAYLRKQNVVLKLIEEAFEHKLIIRMGKSKPRIISFPFTTPINIFENKCKKMSFSKFKEQFKLLEIDMQDFQKQKATFGDFPPDDKLIPYLFDKQVYGTFRKDSYNSIFDFTVFRYYRCVNILEPQLFIFEKQQIEEDRIWRDNVIENVFRDRGFINTQPFYYMISPKQFNNLELIQLQN